MQLAVWDYTSRMSILNCSVTVPPVAEEGVVKLTLLHQPSGELFLCRLQSIDDINIALLPEGLTPHADGEVRAAVAEAAQQYALRHRDELASLFAEAALQRTQEAS